MKLTNDQAYQQLINSRVQWDRKDQNHIVVWTSGYLTADCHTIEDFLMRAGMYIVDQNFDKYCGKTKTVYKHK